jgi:hypothetical protein
MLWADNINRIFRSVVLGSIAFVVMVSNASAGTLVMTGVDVNAVTVQATPGSFLANGAFLVGNGLGSGSIDEFVAGPATLNNVSLNVFCVDLLTNISNFPGATYAQTLVDGVGTVDSLNTNLPSVLATNPYGNSSGLVNGFGAIAWLVEHFGQGTLTSDAREGLQATIWKVEYGNDISLVPGSTTPGAAIAFQADLLAVGYTQVLGSTPYDPYTLGTLESSPLGSAIWISPGSDLVSYPGYTVDGNGNAVQGLVAFAVPVPLPGSIAIWLSVGMTAVLVWACRRESATA